MGLEQDEDAHNYLFNLPNEYCVDARRIGNNTRYMNHAGDNPKGDGSRKGKKATETRGPRPSVRARILTVDGDPRIGFYALSDILAAGKEVGKLSEDTSFWVNLIYLVLMRTCLEAVL